MKKTTFVILLALLALCLVIVACNKDKGGSAPAAPVASTSQPAGGPLAGKRIGVINSTMYDEWNIGIVEEFARIGKEKGAAEINIQDGDSSAEIQTRLLEDFITQRVDAIFIQPVDSSGGILAALDKAHAAGIPVVVYGMAVDWPSYVSYIAWDHAETGRLSGLWAVDYAKKNLGGKLRVGILSMLIVQATAIRTGAFKEAIEEGLGKENITYVFEQDFGMTREGAANIVTNNIAKPVDIIWAAVDNGSFGARAALQMSGVVGPKVISSGAWGKESFQTIADNDPHYAMFIGVPPEGIVRQSLEAGEAYFRGETNIPKDQNIELVVVDSTNIANFKGKY